MSNILTTINLSEFWKKQKTSTNFSKDKTLKNKIKNNLLNFINLDKKFSMKSVFKNGHTYIKTNVNQIFNLDSDISQLIFNYQYKTFLANIVNYNNRSKHFINNLKNFLLLSIEELLEQLFTKIFISDHLPVLDDNNKIMSWNIEHDIITLEQSLKTNNIYTDFNKLFQRYIILKNYCIINIIYNLIKSNYICCIQEGSYLLLWLLYQTLSNKCHINYTARPWHPENQRDKWKGRNTFFYYLRNHKELNKYPYKDIPNIDSRCIFVLNITIIPKTDGDIIISQSIPAEVNSRNITSDFLKYNQTCPNLFRRPTGSHFISINRGLQTTISNSNKTIIIINMHLKADNIQGTLANSKLTLNDKKYFDNLIKRLIQNLNNKTQIHVVGDFNCSGDLIFKHIKTMSNNYKFEGIYTICKELHTAVDGIFTIKNNTRVQFKDEPSILQISLRKKNEFTIKQKCRIIKYYLLKIINNKDILELLLKKLDEYLERNEIDKINNIFEYIVFSSVKKLETT